MQRESLLKQCAVNAVIILIILFVYFASTHPLAVQVVNGIAGIPIYRGSQNIALCFKVEETIPENLLQTLYESDVPATFFISPQAAKNTLLIKKLYTTGHEIGVLGGISSQEAQEAIREVETSFDQIDLKLSNYYMPADHTMVADAHLSASLGYQMVICGIHVFTDELPEKHTAQTMQHPLYEGAYILVPTAKEADAVLKKIIQNAKEKGFIFSTLSDTK